MKSFSALLLILPVVLAARINLDAHGDPTPTTEIQDGQTGTLIVIPPQATETSGIKQIPDADHPFIAPGPDDQRGPCPAMNTLANHGYISRNGVATFEEIVIGMMEAFNLEVNFASNMVANNMLTRGNPFVNKISIGGVSPLVPPLPGKIDGPETGGIAKHGRFEGDASMTRADAFIGDNRNFQEALYDEDLVQLAKFGDDGPDGEDTVFNVQTLIAMKTQNIMSDQAANPKFEFAPRRMNAAYGQSAFILNLFANGTTKQATLPIISSFFRDQTFPQNWFRATSLITGAVNAPTVAQILSAVGVAPGRNNQEGVYVADPPPPAPFNASLVCSAYWDQARNIPAVLLNTTGIFKKNVDLLTSIQFANSKGVSRAKSWIYGWLSFKMT
ncbi:Chloroperoxidase [Mycena floridula]|nr:Chloroperoxidase [Mycena floridula]